MSPRRAPEPPPKAPKPSAHGVRCQCIVCRARRTKNGIEASVKPEKILSTQPMAKIANTSSYIYFETDIFPGLAITEENPGLYATAYGLLADFVRAVKD